MVLGVTSPSLHELHSFPRARPTATPHGVCTAHFGELHGPLLNFVEHSQVLVGCVAWVTSGKILDALARKQVALVVQKERWWKAGDVRGTTLARRYAALRGGLPAAAFPAPLSVWMFRGKPQESRAFLAPIACVGYGGGGQFQPLMHHKFIVRCELVDGRLVPSAVWTGSFNFSEMANNSFENAVEIHDPAIAAAYLEEFSLVASVAEPMTWRFVRPTPKGPVSAVLPPPPPLAAQKKAKAVKRPVKKTASKSVRRVRKKAAA